MTTHRAADEVRHAMDRWLRAFNGRDIDALMAVYDPEIVYANAGAPLMRGVEQVRTWFEELFKGPPLRVLLREETLLVGQSMALVAGKYHFRTVDEEGGVSPGDAGRVCVVFRLADDGRWLMAYDTDNTPPDCKGSDFEGIPTPGPQDGGKP